MLRSLVWISLAAVPAVCAQSALPVEWVDPDTGHRVVRLSREDGTQSLYFNQNAYTADGKKLIVTTAGGGISTITLATRAVTPLVPGPVSVLVAGHKSGDVYYTKRMGGPNGAPGDRNSTGATVYATNVDTGATREVVKLPPGRMVSSLNADETLLLGTYVDGPPREPSAAGRGGRGGRASGNNFGQPNYQAVGPDGKPMTFADAKDLMLHNQLMAARTGPPRVLFTVNTRSGEVKEIFREHEWLGHLQFSPTDPNLIMFCHEGTWHEVDRVWTIHTDGSGLTKIHVRTMNMEIAGHEFFSADGSTIYYDLQTPRGLDFWLAAFKIATGKRTWYHLDRNEWSVHFNGSPDGKLFAGDGGDSEMVARAPDGKWIYLFRPEPVSDVAGVHAPNSDALIDVNYFKSERLVNMKKHDYRLEPNVTFSPDMKWVVFRSNMLGPVHVYAAEIAKADFAK
ncbi:MAG TPA: oligogalacturonate lyase family protein [Bryobacteraceae bacterium]|nr:oligogalacturonate lyase family protein [Bryobacteraceae bacterium]